MKKLSDSQMAKEVAAYFKSYPKAVELYFAEDGSCFLNKDLANSHANSTKQKIVTKSRAAYEASELAKKKTQEKAAALKALKEQLLAFELVEDCDWDELRTLGKAFSVSASTKEEYLAALTELKSNLEKK